MQLRILMLVLSVLQGRLLMPGLLCLLVASMAWVAVAEPERGPLILDMHLHALPAPGGASSTAPPCSARQRHSSGSTASTGRAKYRGSVMAVSYRK